MKTFRLLGGASCLAILASAGASQALETLRDVPVSATALSSEQLDLYIGPGLSAFNAGVIVPEVSAGVKLRGLGNSRLSWSIDGSLGLQQPAGVAELWVGSRLGFQPDDLSRIEVLTGAAIGTINGGGPYYRLSGGAEFGISPQAGILVEGVTRGAFGSAPTDFGIHVSALFYPGRFADHPVDVLRGPRGTLYAGPSITVIPSASAAVPAIDGGWTYKLNNKFDLGLRGSLGMQFPAGTYEVSAGGEAGYELSPELRAFLFGDVGLIGSSFTFNRIGIGGEFRATPTFSLVGELSGRGAIGTITEGSFKFGTRFNFMPTILDTNVDPTVPIVADTGFDPYVGKSIGVTASGGTFTPAINFGLNVPQQNRIIPGLRGRVGYEWPGGVVETFGGIKLGYAATPTFNPYVFVEAGLAGGTPEGSVGAGGDLWINDSWTIGGELFGKAHWGGPISPTMGIRFSADYHLPPGPWGAGF